MSAFILGAYVYGATHEHSPKLIQWICTIGSGIMFFILSKKEE